MAGLTPHPKSHLAGTGPDPGVALNPCPATPRKIPDLFPGLPFPMQMLKIVHEAFVNPGDT